MYPGVLRPGGAAKSWRARGRRSERGSGPRLSGSSRRRGRGRKRSRGRPRKREPRPRGRPPSCRSR